MKPEPLKDKKVFMIVVECSNCKEREPAKCNYFKPKDVKSTVEWLKENIDVNYIYWKQNRIKEKVMNLIDKAFEDVTKK